MSIVTRGLGLGGVLVTAGLGLALSIIVVPPTTLPSGSYPPWTTLPTDKGRLVEARIAATITLPAIQATGLLAKILAKGSASVSLYVQDSSSKVGVFTSSGSATASVIGVSASTFLGEMLATGQHDLEDEAILTLLLTLLDAESLV